MKKSLLFVCIGLSTVLAVTGCNITEAVEEEPVLQEEIIEITEEETIKEENILYQHGFYDGYRSYTETFIYDAEGNFVNCEYSGGGKDDISASEFYTQIGFEPSWCDDFRYGKVSDCNLEMLSSVEASGYSYDSSTGQIGSLSSVEVNENNQVVGITPSFEYEIEDITWNEEGNLTFKYYHNSYHYEKRFENNHLVYYGVTWEDGLYAIGYRDAGHKYTEYTYDGDTLIMQRNVGSDDSVDVIYYVYNSDGDLVARVEDWDNDDTLDIVLLFCHVREYDEDGNLIKHQVLTPSDDLLIDYNDYEDIEIIENTPIDELQDVCSEASNKYCAIIEEDGVVDKDEIDDNYVEYWEYKPLSEIISEN